MYLIWSPGVSAEIARSSTRDRGTADRIHVPHLEPRSLSGNRSVLHKRPRHGRSDTCTSSGAPESQRKSLGPPQETAARQIGYMYLIWSPGVSAEIARSSTRDRG